VPLVRRLEPDITYHPLGYHEASATMEAAGTVPVLLHYQGDRAEMAIPLLLRPLPDNQGWDATSAYGFGGPCRPPGSKIQGSATLSTSGLSRTTSSHHSSATNHSSTTTV